MKRVLNIVVALVAFAVLLPSCTAEVQQEKSNKVVKTGIDVLESNGFKQLQGKKVGLVTNPSGVNNKLVSTVDILANAPGVELVALYGPEHGVRGDIHAGDKVSDEVDPKTGVPVYSLYGKTRKPTPEMLKDIDAIVYDIQDNGCRSFTFISTLGLLMEAAAENGKEVIVLDRPNPLGGNKVEGNIVEAGNFSFVSQFEIPYLYGLTVGELAQMLNEEGMLKGEKGTNDTIVKCNLTVVPMEGWSRDMVYTDTRLPWVLPSPHMPQAETSYYYPATGILGELGYMSIGVGYTLPFQMVAAPWINAADFADALNALNLPGVTFRPINVKPFYSVGKGENMGGVQIYITDYEKAHLTSIQFYIMQEVARMYPEHEVMANANTGRFRMFDLVSGTNFIREKFTETKQYKDIEAYWNKDVESFRQKSAKYHLYK
ncbi:MAG: DUF1343 domain-containing protein [Bacteroidales bacterium]|nr:DUF1343 domain-containing protein [Bacteroidales bacterium]MBQ8645938.1 DUF1343 domain-containing protein [Bacteroidales bacterium]MBR1950454.1 DUF1343 domain-containing protein [Bacteroidales bacterium]